VLLLGWHQSDGELCRREGGKKGGTTDVYRKYRLKQSVQRVIALSSACFLRGFSPAVNDSPSITLTPFSPLKTTLNDGKPSITHHTWAEALSHTCRGSIWLCLCVYSCLVGSSVSCLVCRMSFVACPFGSQPGRVCPSAGCPVCLSAVWRAPFRFASFRFVRIVCRVWLPMWWAGRTTDN